MQIVYRACRRSDLTTGLRSLLNQGLANHRGSDVNAIFGNAGYRTNGMSSTTDPLVAFTYACMQAAGAHEIVVFAIVIDFKTANAGLVQRQATEQNIAPDSVTGKSVAAQREVVLPNVSRSALLGHYAIRKRGDFFELGHWTAMEGNVQMQSHARLALSHAVMQFARRCGGVVSEQMCEKELNRMMGH
ncbi:hypothetical protein [Massilia scottii]|uniref:hypothetical protein n=1 Tax=Massilia scottii TaxID=3057166 RepID=UPI002796865B|nr:hypothetical protein [Massilia sp. CCM 9029]MDQ1834539.1 hypothetical protein [Massilia sp. CCM 9029]